MHSKTAYLYLQKPGEQTNSKTKNKTKNTKKTLCWLTAKRLQIASQIKLYIKGNICTQEKLDATYANHGPNPEQQNLTE